MPRDVWVGWRRMVVLIGGLEPRIHVSRLDPVQSPREDQSPTHSRNRTILKTSVGECGRGWQHEVTVSDSTLTDLVARLERERLEADRRYNEALTALDQALPGTVELPAAPSLVDDRPLSEAGRELEPGPSPIAGQGILDRRIASSVVRHLGPSLEQQRRFNAAVFEELRLGVTADREARAAGRLLVAAIRQHLDELAAFNSRLVQFLQQITPYVDTKDRAMGGTELRDQIALVNERTLSLKRELERQHSSDDRPAKPTEATGGPGIPADREAFKYLSFEDRFRGSRDEIRRRLSDYLPIFAGATGVLDVGCGRGELLELFGEAGIDARGIDANERMVSVCTERGLRAEHAEAVGYLRSRPDGSLGGLTAIQVVEHFQPDYLMAFLESAYHALRPGSALILETINPACWMAFFETYLRDLTHVRPLHPDTLRFLAEASGFSRAEITLRIPVREADRLPRVDVTAFGDESLRALGLALNAHADRLNARLFSSMDYALVARR